MMKTNRAQRTQVRGFTLVELPAVSKRAFTLVELLVVIGIMAVLMGLLLPALRRAQQQANGVKCLSNLRQIGIYMTMYANDNRGLLIPLGPLQDGTNGTTATPDPEDTSQYLYQTLGAEVYPWQRYPYLLISSGSYAPIPTDPTYITSTWTPTILTQGLDPEGSLSAPWTPPIYTCPTDDQPAPSAAHTYIFNSHLVENPAKVLKYSGHVSSRGSADLVVLGEKRTVVSDYYMEAGDITINGNAGTSNKVDLYKHGIKLGSNYLFKDMHAANTPPAQIAANLDPWDY
jgi:prepilin-type N-terminal cleavage/methylation domain-containing protein